MALQQYEKPANYPHLNDEENIMEEIIKTMMFCTM
jgi:hypothetical protein